VRCGNFRHFAYELDGIVPFVDPLAASHAKAGGREGKKVGTTIDLVDPAGGLFGRHERGRPKRQPVRRDGFPLQQPRKPEVEDLDLHGAGRRTCLRAGEKDVLRFEVAVHDAARVRRLEHLEHALRHPEKLDLAQRRLALEAVLQRFAFEKLHDKVGRPRVRTIRDDIVVEHLDRSRVIHAVGHIALAQKALAHVAPSGELPVKNLHGASRPVAMACCIDSGHPP